MVKHVLRKFNTLMWGFSRQYTAMLKRAAIESPSSLVQTTQWNNLQLILMSLAITNFATIHIPCYCNDCLHSWFV